MLTKLIQKNISELNRFNILENIKLVFYIGLFIFAMPKKVQESALLPRRVA